MAATMPSFNAKQNEQTHGGDPAKLLWYKGDAAIVHLEGFKAYAREVDVVLSKKFGALLERCLPSSYQDLGLVCEEDSETAVSVVESFEVLILCGGVTPALDKLHEALRTVLLVGENEPEDKLELAVSLAAERILRAGHAMREPVPLTLPVHLPPATWRCSTEEYKRVREVSDIMSTVTNLQANFEVGVRASTVAAFIKLSKHPMSADQL